MNRNELIREIVTRNVLECVDKIVDEIKEYLDSYEWE